MKNKEDSSLYVNLNISNHEAINDAKTSVCVKGDVCISGFAYLLNIFK